MKLWIEFKKEQHKPSVLTCTRENGSCTYSAIYPNLEIHDLAHYVVETELGYKNAFYGLLAQGHSISDFQLPKTERPLSLHPRNLHPEALITEHIANLLQTAYKRPEQDLGLLKTLGKILEGNNLPFPTNLTSEKLLVIAEKLEVLMKKWEKISYGDKLELVLEL